MQRPKFVWAVTIVSVLGFLLMIVNFIKGITSTVTTRGAPVLMTQKIFFVAYLILGVLGMFFIYNLFMLKRDKSKLWNNIVALGALILTVFGILHDSEVMGVLSDSSQQVLIQSYAYPAIVVGFVYLLMILLFWNIFRKYLNKSKSFS
ncbi:hypothetical protein AYK26_01170 [Euryarchaeota archaeon SM23-78]|nr:MAG: hypothetical protein AYK26_01170 [Euryarchaeota archaeon SM23-78]MBW3001438.1 hypothetical protein [Candidatus Woesearchaeota archaeon]